MEMSTHLYAHKAGKRCCLPSSVTLYSFEAASLPEPRAGVFSASLEGSWQTLVILLTLCLTPPTVELGLQAFVGYPACYVGAGIESPVFLIV